MIFDRARQLTTPHLADGCLRAGVEARTLPLSPVAAGSRLAGRVLPVQHFGSVDIFLEAIEGAEPGDILVIDNQGRVDEACAGDLVVIEAREAGLGGVLIWGRHRDTADIIEIGLPVFSLGAIPTGPVHFGTRTPDALTSAQLGPWRVSRDDAVVADEDGVVIIPFTALEDVVTAAEAIRDVERRQAEAIAAGTSLRTQVRFSEYLAARASEPSLTFREHLRRVGGAIEV